jgi:hypothetical protein
MNQQLFSKASTYAENSQVFERFAPRWPGAGLYLLRGAEKNLSSMSKKPVQRRQRFPLSTKVLIRLVLSTQDDTFWLSYDTLYHTTAKMYHLDCLKLT